MASAAPTHPHRNPQPTTPIPPRQDDERRRGAQAGKRKFNASDAAPNADFVKREVAAGHMRPTGRDAPAGELPPPDAAAAEPAQQQQQQALPGPPPVQQQQGGQRAPLYASECV